MEQLRNVANDWRALCEHRGIVQECLLACEGIVEELIRGGWCQWCVVCDMV